jgi:hypothetical protein
MFASKHISMRCGKGIYSPRSRDSDILWAISRRLYDVLMQTLQWGMCTCSEAHAPGKQGQSKILLDSPPQLPASALQESISLYHYWSTWLVNSWPTGFLEGVVMICRNHASTQTLHSVDPMSSSYAFLVFHFPPPFPSVFFHSFIFSVLYAICVKLKEKRRDKDTLFYA